MVIEDTITKLAEVIQERIRMKKCKTTNLLHILHWIHASKVTTEYILNHIKGTFAEGIQNPDQRIILTFLFEKHLPKF